MEKHLEWLIDLKEAEDLLYQKCDIDNKYSTHETEIVEFLCKCKKYFEFALKNEDVDLLLFSRKRISFWNSRLLLISVDSEVPIAIEVKQIDISWRKQRQEVEIDISPIFPELENLIKNVDYLTEVSMSEGPNPNFGNTWIFAKRKFDKYNIGNRKAALNAEKKKTLKKVFSIEKLFDELLNENHQNIISPYELDVPYKGEKEKYFQLVQ